MPMEARNRSLAEWFSSIRNGSLRVPRFQRFEAWGARNVGDLLQTVIDELPAGSTLMLKFSETDGRPIFRHRPLEGAPDTGEPDELILDGQQRLTALWRALSDEGYPDRVYFVRWRPVPGKTEDQERKYLVESEARYRRKDGRMAPIWADEPRHIYERGLLPMRLLRPDAEAEQQFNKWLEQAAPDLEERFRLQGIGLKLRSLFASFNLPFLDLRTTSKSVALEVFVKLNTRLVKLTAYDVVVAEVEAEAGESLHDLVAELRSHAPDFHLFTDPEDVVLSVAALIQDQVPNEKGFYALDYRRLVSDWSLILNGAKKAGEFLRQERLLDEERLPTEAVLAPLAALWARAPEAPDALGNVRLRLRKYIWRAFLTRRYERSVPTFALQDFRALRDNIGGNARVEPPIFDEELYPIPGPEELLTGGWPKTRDRLARAILQISLLGGAEDIADGAEISPANVVRREYHHLYPVGFLGPEKTQEGRAYRALNCALITWRTNRVLSAKPPLQYLLERSEAIDLGETEVRRRLATHGISYEALARARYDEFLVSRAERFAEAARALADGKVWRPWG